MRNVKWAKDALLDLENIVGFIARDNPLNATAVRLRVEQTATQLGKRPIGRPSRMQSVFEKSVLKTQLIIAYSLTNEDVVILRIIHSAQNWTPQNFPKP
jgi:plasmid stabilization system protein ParE